MIYINIKQTLLVLISQLVVGLLVTACGGVTTPGPGTTIAPVSSLSLPALPTPTTFPTSVDAALPPATATLLVPRDEDWFAVIITDTVARFGTALIDAEFATARTFMSDSILLGREATALSSETVATETALLWLEQHWQPELSVSLPDYVQHYNLVRVDVTGWQTDDAAPTGHVRFHLHSHLGADSIPVWTVDTVLTW